MVKKRGRARPIQSSSTRSQQESKILLITLGVVFFLFLLFQGAAGTTGFISAEVENHPPEWFSLTDTFILKDSPTLNLNDYFFDEDYDELTFAISPNPYLHTNIVGNLLTISPVTGFTTATLTVIAYDGKVATKKEIVIQQ